MDSLWVMGYSHGVAQTFRCMGMLDGIRYGMFIVGVHFCKMRLGRTIQECPANSV